MVANRLLTASSRASNLFIAAISAVLLLFSGPVAKAQAPAWQSAVAFNCIITATATNASGDVYLTGYFNNATSFGSFNLTATSGYGRDVFVAKWSAATKNFVWVQQAGGDLDDFARAIAVSGPNVYIAGNFNGSTATFGPAIVTNVQGGLGDVFVAKLVDAGTSAGFIWAQQAGGSGTDVATSLAVSGADIFAIGTFNGPTCQFGATNLVSASGNSGNNNAFMCKLTDAGVTSGYVWAQRFGSTNSDYLSAIAASGASIYITGSFSSANLTLGNITLTNAGVGTGDAYVAKLLAAGPAANFVWAQRAGSADNEGASALAVNGTNVYIGGTFGGAAFTFGNTTLTNTSTSTGSSKMFVAKLVDAGTTNTLSWAQQGGGEYDTFANSLAVNGTNVYVAGTFGSPTAAFGGTTLTNTTTLGRTIDIYVAKLYDAGSTGNFAWAQSAGGRLEDNVSGLAASGNTVYVVGTTDGGAKFGSITPGYFNTTSYLASIVDNTALATSAPVVASANPNLYPNPIRNKVTVQLPPIPSVVQATLTLVDAMGRVALTRTVAVPTAGLQYPFDLVGLAPGVYSLQVQAGVTRTVRRLVID